MNWKLIFTLSLLGLVMAAGTLYVIPSYLEPFCWLAIFVVNAYYIAKLCSRSYFMNGFVLSLVNAVWVTAVHLLFFPTYWKFHPEAMQMNAQMPMPEHPRVMMLVTGPLIGILSGVVQGAFAYVASRLVKRQSLRKKQHV